MSLTWFLKAILLPPGLQIVLILLGLIGISSRLNWLRRICKLSLWSGLLSLWLLSLPVVSNWLFYPLEAPYTAYTSEEPPEGLDAIVMLGAGRHYDAGEYGGDTVSHSALWRIRYAAYLAKRWDLPVIISGGKVKSFDKLSEAQIGSSFLNELGVTEVIQEPDSRTTWENAIYTTQLLAQKGHSDIALVTHGYHMRRAIYSFQQAIKGSSINLVPMPTGMKFSSKRGGYWEDWLPSASSLHDSRTALHEYLGLLFYFLK